MQWHAKQQVKIDVYASAMYTEVDKNKRER
jgi:hypothetical protein